jgi:hypothetical protein
MAGLAALLPAANPFFFARARGAGWRRGSSNGPLPRAGRRSGHRGCGRAEAHSRSDAGCPHRACALFARPRGESRSSSTRSAKTGPHLSSGRPAGVRSRYDDEDAWPASSEPALRLALRRLKPARESVSPVAPKAGRRRSRMSCLHYVLDPESDCARHDCRLAELKIARPGPIWRLPIRRAQCELNAGSGSETASCVHAADGRKTARAHSPRQSRPCP